ncbi:MAG: isoprenylcysteine carboxylmethyltransferase family protein [Anaerolineae bacterium]|nr:isoprenylcysteine carboxylmethyltransferase family protein [Anaerolineae bacterium]
MQLTENGTVADAQRPTRRSLGPGAVALFAVYVLLAPAVLFLTSGDWRWGMGWAYSITVVVLSVASRGVAFLVNRDLLAERARGVGGEGVKPWDRLLSPLTGLVGPLVIWATAGLDQRLGWSVDLALGLQIMALAVVVLSYGVGTWAMAVNPFLSGGVRIQAERGHRVVDTGPYSYVRHPGYAAALISYLATPLALDSLWGLAPGLLTGALLVVRTILEDQTLSEELPGYRQYTEKVRYRLVPGVW